MENEIRLIGIGIGLASLGWTIFFYWLIFRSGRYKFIGKKEDGMP